VISNLAAPYGPALRRLLGDRVDGFSLSFEVGAMKPEPEIFAHACRNLALSPDQMLMVGDSHRSDVEGAEAFGMRAVRLRRGHESEWPHSVGSLTELASRLLG
jgi:FMN phosphatase YigB (HAD superfamily)